MVAEQAIFARTGASIEGRLLARIAEVTLQTNDITVPAGCSNDGVVSSSPVVTSGSPTAARLGLPYDFTVAASSAPAPTYSIDSGSLPVGLTLDAATGRIAGTPTTLGSSSFVVRVSNGVAPDALTALAITVSPAALAATGVDGSIALAGIAAVLLLAGVLLMRRRLVTP